MQGRHHGHAPRVVAKKQFGQNFLVDADVLAQIVDAITSVNIRQLIEVGPGTGVLTAALLPHADHLTSVEFDRDLVPFLEKSFADRGNFTLVQGDILLFQPPAGDIPYHLVGNIPYNLTTKLFEKILLWDNKPSAITFLIQKEVAEKVTQKGGKNSPLALAAEMLGEAKLLFDVPPSAFQPQPKVMSSVIQVVAHGSPRVADPYALYDFAHKLFRNPRKTLLNNLLAMMPKEKAMELMEKNGLDPMLRPERLDFEAIRKTFEGWPTRS